MEKLKQLRKEKGLTQEEIANIIGVSKNTVSRYELGSREPDFETLNKLAEIFSCTTDYLLGRTSVADMGYKQSPRGDFFSTDAQQNTPPIEEEDEVSYYYDKLLKADKATQDIIKALLDKEVPDQ